MKKPPDRFWSRSAIDFVAKRLGLRNSARMQDWPYEVADPKDIDRYLILFGEVDGRDDVRFVLADMIIQAFEELGGATAADARWRWFLSAVGRRPELHAHQIWYWSDFGRPLSEAWNVAPDMRELALEVL